MISVPDSSYEVTYSSFADGFYDCDFYAALVKAIWYPYDVEICCQLLKGSFELVCPECGGKLVCKDVCSVTKHGIYDQTITINLERWLCNNPGCNGSCKSHVILPESLIPRLWYPALVLKLCLDLIEPETVGLNPDEIEAFSAFKSSHARLLKRWKKKLCAEVEEPKTPEQPQAQPPEQPPAPPPEKPQTQPLEQPPQRIPLYLCLLCRCSRSGLKITAKPQAGAERIDVFAIEICPSGPGPPCPELSTLWHCCARVAAIPYSHRETDRCCSARPRVFAAVYNNL